MAASVIYKQKVQAPAFTVERADGTTRDLGADTAMDSQRILSRIDRWRILNANDTFGVLGNANNLTPGQLRAFPLVVESDLRVSQLSVFVTAAAVAGNRLRFGLYRARADGMPEALVYQTPEFIAETNNAELTATITGGLLLVPDIYYFAVLTNGGMALRGVPLSMQRMAIWFANPSVTTPVTRLEVAQAYVAGAGGALPATFPSGYAQANGSGFTPAALFVKTSNP